MMVPCLRDCTVTHRLVHSCRHAQKIQNNIKNILGAMHWLMSSIEAQRQFCCACVSLRVEKMSLR
jgi:hypothetical protein